VWERFRYGGNHATEFGNVSATAEIMLQSLGTFPLRRKSCHRVWERFRHGGNHATEFGNISATAEIIQQNSRI
ncbi:MAG: hypothetical protein J5605_09190, partial [Bacteroidales bacterium]|nr:hypothetical protein [Bacteroidales bacterium]